MERKSSLTRRKPGIQIAADLVQRSSGGWSVGQIAKELHDSVALGYALLFCGLPFGPPSIAVRPRWRKCQSNTLAPRAFFTRAVT